MSGAGKTDSHMGNDRDDLARCKNPTFVKAGGWFTPRFTPEAQQRKMG